MSDTVVLSRTLYSYPLLMDFRINLLESQNLKCNSCLTTQDDIIGHFIDCMRDTPYSRCLKDSTSKREQQRRDIQ